MSVTSFAQEKYPVKPINFFLGYPLGGSADLCTRPLTEAAGKILGQTIVILNKPGRSGGVAVSLLKKEQLDGYTIGLLPMGAVLNQLT